MENVKNTCELVNTYEVLEHIMGIEGLHPHSLKTIDLIFEEVALHTNSQEGVILDVGCGSGLGSYNLSCKLSESVSIIGIDINGASIEKARANYADIENMSFYQGTLEAFHQENSDLKVIGIVSVSVSMFLPDISNFYKISHDILSDNGIFVDAPFVFQEGKTIDVVFKNKTYAVCGCNMTMKTTEQLQQFVTESGFDEIKAQTHNFELMNMNKLFKDYPFRSLISNFTKNVITPPSALAGQSSWYLLKRTLSIFSFFMKNRDNYGAGIIKAIKTKPS